MKINGLRNYYRDIKKNLNCSSKEKHYLMEQIMCEINEYIETNNITELNYITNHFGLAKDFTSYCDNKTLNVRNEKKFVMLSLLLIILIIVISVIIVFCIINHHEPTIIIKEEH